MDDWNEILDNVLGGPGDEATATLAREATPPGQGEWDDALDSVLDPRWQDKQMAAARERFKGTEEPLAARIAKRSMPFVSPLATTFADSDYEQARGRFEAGQASYDDIQHIASRDRVRQEEAGRSTGGKIADALLNIPAVVGEAGVGKGMTLAGRVALTPLMPSFFLPGASQRSLEQGGGFAAPQNLVPALATGAIQNLILGALPNVGQGIANPVSRLAARGAANVGENQVGDAVLSGLDQFLPEAYQTKTRFGLLGHLMRGERGEALQKGVVDLVTGAAFALAHGNPRAGPAAKVAIEDAAKVIDAEAAKGVAPEAAVKEARRTLVRIGGSEPVTRRAGMPGPESLALDKFGEGNVFRVDLVGPDNKSVGYGVVAEEGDTIHVPWMGGAGLAGGEGRGKADVFGVREIIGLARELAFAMPEMKFVKYTPSAGRIRAGEARIIDLAEIRGRAGKGQPKPADVQAPQEKPAESTPQATPQAETPPAAPESPRTAPAPEAARKPPEAVRTPPELSQELPAEGATVEWTGGFPPQTRRGVVTGYAADPTTGGRVPLIRQGDGQPFPVAEFLESGRVVAKPAESPVEPAPAPEAPPSGLVNVRDRIREAGDDLGAAGARLRQEIADHIRSGGAVSLWMDGKEVPVAKVDGDRVRDAQGNQWGMGPLAMSKPGTKSGVEFKPAPPAEPEPFVHLSREEMEQLSEQLVGRKMVTPAKLVDALRRLGHNPAGIRNLSEMTKSQGRPAAQVIPPEQRPAEPTRTPPLEARPAATPADAEAMGIAGRMRDVVEHLSGGDVSDYCVSTAHALKKLYPGTELYQGKYKGQFHVVAKVGEHFIDVTADQFGGPTVQAFRDMPPEYESFRKADSKEHVPLSDGIVSRFRRRGEGLSHEAITELEMAEPTGRETPAPSPDRLTALLARAKAQRDEAAAELTRAFPHGRPAAHPKGYDDRAAAVAEHDARIADLSARLGEPAPTPEPGQVGSDSPPDSERPAELDKLTPREEEVLRRLVLEGATLEEVGQEQKRPVTRQRVEQIAKAALKKLGAEKSVGQIVEQAKPEALAERLALGVEDGATQAERVDMAELSGAYDPETGKRLRELAKDAETKRQDAYNDALDEALREADKLRKQGYSPEAIREVFKPLATKAEGLIYGRRQEGRAASPEGEGGPAGRTEEAAGRHPDVQPDPGRAGQDAGEPPAEAPGVLSEAEATAASLKLAEARTKPRVSPAERMRRGRAVPKEFEALAKEAGIPADDIHDAAKWAIDQQREATANARQFYNDADDALKEYGLSAQAVGQIGRKGLRDAGSIRGIDEVAEDLADKYPAFFDLRHGHASDQLLEFLTAGKPEALTERQAYEQALDYLIESKVNDARREAGRSGLAPGAAEAALRAGEGAGEAEEAPRPGEADDSGAADVGDFGFGFGAPLTEAEQRTGLAGGQPGAGESRRPQRLTALANAKVDEERAAANLPPLMSAARRANPEVWDAAMARLDADPQLGARLVEELAAKSRATTVDENALLLHRRVALSNEHRRAMAEFIQGFKDKSSALDLDRMEARERELYGQIDRLDKVTRSTGTEWGRAGQFRRQLAAEDYTLASMLLQAESAKGEPLSRDETIRISELQAKIEDLQAKLAEAEGTSIGREGFEATRPTRVAAQDAQNEFARIVAGYRKQNRGWGQKLSDFLIKLRVNEVISSPVTLGKIVAASAERVAIAPFEEVAGAFWAKVPGLAKIAALAPREGRGYSPTAEKRAFLGSFTEGLKDSWRTLRKGESELDVLHGEDKGVPREWLDLQFSLHAAAKAPAVRAEYTRSFLKRIDAGAARGEDVTSPAALLRISADAYKDSQAAKFQQDNWLVDAYNRAISTLRDPKAPVAAQVTGTVAKLLTPVVRIPTNLAFEVATYAFGTGTGSVQATRAWMKGVQNLKPAEADAIMRQFKKGSLGLAALMIGYANPTIFGGYYSGKRDEKDVKVGAMRLDGVIVPSFLLHNPLLEVLQMGATIRRASDKLYKGSGQGILTGVGQGLTGLADEIPFVREMREVAKGVSPNARERGAFFGELAKSFLVPQFFQWLAGRMDTNAQGEVRKRKPGGVLQHVETGIPGLRQSVPAR